MNFMEILNSSDINKLIAFLREHDINDSFQGGTLLTKSVFMNNIVISEFLIKQGADINKMDSHGRTPLQITCFFGFAQIANLLIENGATVDKVCFEKAINGWDGNSQKEILDLLK